MSLHQKRDGYVWSPDLREPVTEELWDQLSLNDEIALGLVRTANGVDLENIAEAVR
jgi:hypothetical protein